MSRAQKFIRHRTLSVEEGETGKQVIPPALNSAELEKVQGGLEDRWRGLGRR